MIIQAKVRSKMDLLQSDICLGAADVEQLASLPAHYFFDSAAIVALEPKLKEKDKAPHGPGTIVPLRKPS
jgi:hypothetical protein